MISWIPKDKLFNRMQKELKPAKTVLDIGCGIRPQEFQIESLQICTDPYDQYVKLLNEATIKSDLKNRRIILQANWEQIIESLPPKSVDNVYLLDVIEHLDKQKGIELLKKTEKVAKKQIVIFTPLGFLPQKPAGKDAWGLDGSLFQEHKSGWNLEDFDHSWKIFASKNFHEVEGEKYGAFFALKNLKVEKFSGPNFRGLWRLLNLSATNKALQVQEIKKIVDQFYRPASPVMEKFIRYYLGMKLILARYNLKKIAKYILKKSQPPRKVVKNITTEWLNKGRDMAITGIGSNLCLDYGFLPIPIHFYSSIPDIKDLEARKVWDNKSELPGIDFRVNEQLKFLGLLSKFSQECDWPQNKTLNELDFYVNNPSFSYGCAASLYTIIRYYRPKKIIEVGSGNSSKVIHQAIKKNQEEDKNYQPRYLIIDPYPSDYIKNIPEAELISERVELVDRKIFDKLGLNDLLFIDSSHSVKIGSDVNYLYLEVLPRIKPGVVIHTHDIDLPYEYPKAYATNEVFRQFWTEQYLLQAFLSGNKDFEVLLAMHYIQTDHKDAFSKAFPLYNPKKHLFTSGSFWYRRKEKS